MCELLGMSANVPTDICFSFTGLMQRGGGTGPHRDGWGIVFYEGSGFREFRDPRPGVSSEVARLVKSYPIKAHIVISHIRRATVGKVCLENTHPFSRELWGRYWSFAHNGHLSNSRSLPLDFYRPVGTTDSERAFCWLLGEMRRRFPASPGRPQVVWNTVKRLCDRLGAMGVFNVLLSDSRHLYAFCSTRLARITRRAPFGRAHLKDVEMTVDFQAETTPNDVVTVVATEPLTRDEAWRLMAPGELCVFRGGELVFHKGGTDERG